MPVFTVPPGLVTVAAKVGEAPAPAVMVVAVVVVVAAPMVNVLDTVGETAKLGVWPKTAWIVYDPGAVPAGRG
jgi:hypothetical protein